MGQFDFGEYGAAFCRPDALVRRIGCSPSEEVGDAAAFPRACEAPVVRNYGINLPPLGSEKGLQENRLGRTGKSFTPYREIAYPLQGNFRIPRRFAAPSVMLAFPRVRVHARGMSYGDINNIPY